MAGVDVAHFARGGIDFGNERGGEAAAFEAVSASVAFEAGDDFIERGWRGGQRAEAGLKRGHKQRCRDTFSGDIGDGDDQRTGIHCASRGWARERVVVIAGDRVLRTSGKSDIGARDVRRMIGDEPLLNFARDFQIAFHGDAVGKLKCQE